MAMSEGICGYHNWGAGSGGGGVIKGVEARDTAKHPREPRTGPSSSMTWPTIVWRVRKPGFPWGFPDL